MKYISKYSSPASLFITFFLLGTIVSCVPAAQQPEEVPLTPCPKETLFIPTPFNHNLSNKYIIVLVDKSGSYRRYDSKHDYATESLVLINNVLVKIITPGDRVFIDWIANDKENDQNKVIFEGEVQNIVSRTPDFYSTPSYPELIPAIPVEGGDIQKDKVREQNAEIEKQNQFKLREYYCNVYKWNQDARFVNERNSHQWTQKYENSVSSFLEPMNIAIAEALKEKHAQETHLYEGLSIASRKFHEPLIQKDFKKYILIIFSDMIDSNRGEDYYKNFNIELSGADVLIANYLCLQEYTECLNRSTLVQNQFLDIYGANSATVKFPIETDEEIIINFIRKED